MPTATEAIMAALERNWRMVDAALLGLDEATLARRPSDQCNSIAWILWHMNRVVDTFIHARFQSKPQLWVRDGWRLKFGMSADPEDRGMGWTAQQVAAWAPPSGAVRLGYLEAVKASAREYLGSLSYDDLATQIRIVAQVTKLIITHFTPIPSSFTRGEGSGQA